MRLHEVTIGVAFMSLVPRYKRPKWMRVFIAKLVFRAQRETGVDINKRYSFARVMIKQ